MPLSTASRSLLVVTLGLAAAACTTTVQGTGTSSSSGGTSSGSTSGGTTSGGGTTSSGGTNATGGNTGATGSSSGAGAAEFAPLFGAPTSATITGSTLEGLWAGSASYDQRVKITKTSITIAQKCGDEIVGVTVAASVTSTTIRVLESKDGASSYYCSVSAQPIVIDACADAYDYDCFLLDEGTLEFPATSLFPGSAYTFLKISD